MNSNKTGVRVNKGFVHLNNLYARSIVATTSLYNRLEITQFLVNNYKSKAFFSSIWHLSMYLFNLIEDRRENGLESFENGVLCYLGEEPLNGGTYLWTFLPPNHERIAEYFGRLIEAGIFARVHHEKEKISHSVRAQERNRFVSKIHMKTCKLLKSIYIQGEMSKVFFLWVVCILTCFIGLGLEKVFAFKKKTKVVMFKPSK